MGTASPMQSVRVAQVGSTKYGLYETIVQGQYEIIAQGQDSTKYEHDGSQELYIITDEIGIGQDGIAQLAGRQLNCTTKPIVQNGIVIGYYRIWDACGCSTGCFTYRLTSINHPRNTVSTSLMIR